MQILALRSAARRMAILLCFVCAADIAAVFLTAKPGVVRAHSGIHPYLDSGRYLFAPRPI